MMRRKRGKRIMGMDRDDEEKEEEEDNGDGWG